VLKRQWKKVFLSFYRTNSYSFSSERSTAGCRRNRYNRQIFNFVISYTGLLDDRMQTIGSKSINGGLCCVGVCRMNPRTYYATATRPNCQVRTVLNTFTSMTAVPCRTSYTVFQERWPFGFCLVQFLFWLNYFWSLKLSNIRTMQKICQKIENSHFKSFRTFAQIF
jgi:hypothetical protein